MSGLPKSFYYRWRLDKNMDPVYYGPKNEGVNACWIHFGPVSMAIARSPRSHALGFRTKDMWGVRFEIGLGIWASGLLYMGCQGPGLMINPKPYNLI